MKTKTKFYLPVILLNNSEKHYFASLRVHFWDSHYPDMTQGRAKKGQARWGSTKRGASPVAQQEKNPLAMQEMQETQETQA